MSDLSDTIADLNAVRREMTRREQAAAKDGLSPIELVESDAGYNNLVLTAAFLASKADWLTADSDDNNNGSES